MILNPAIIALESGSLLATSFAGYASLIAMRIIRKWDISSGSEEQLALERKTYLVSTIFACIMAFEIASLFLFTYTADSIHNLFVGAMCAAGSLNVNDYGYPTLVLKVLNCVLCGIWLIINSTDNSTPDYPLIRVKYKFLIMISAALLLETLFQTNYFLGMRADVITSCCGTLFSEDIYTIAGDIAALPTYGTEVIFFLSVIITVRIGVYFLSTGRAAAVFSITAAWLMVLSIASIISFISPYFYELPTHHCPFCLLQKEYHYIGYGLYISLFAGGIAGIGVGVLDRWKNGASSGEVIPILQKRLCLLSMFGYILFTVISAYPMIFFDFSLHGY